MRKPGTQEAEAWINAKGREDGRGGRPLGDEWVVRRGQSRGADGVAGSAVTVATCGSWGREKPCATLERFSVGRRLSKMGSVIASVAAPRRGSTNRDVREKGCTPMRRQSPLVLVVDDEPHIVNVLTMKLRGAGYDVVTAEDGEQAYELALEQLPDLVITDYQMPFLSGLEFAQRLRLAESTSVTPVLMLTARGFTIAAEALAKTNIQAVLSKPFSPRDVASRVEALLEQGPSGGRIHVEATNA